MKKLLIATDGFLPRWDGISRFLNEIIPHLKNIYDITVVCPDFGPTEDNGYKVIKFSPYKKQIGDYYPSKVHIKELDALIKETDIVWVQCLGTIGTLSIILAKKNKKKVALYMHMIEWELFPKGYGNKMLQNPIHQLTKRIGKALYQRCNLIIVPTHELVEILTWMKIFTKKRVVHLGVDTDKFKPRNSTEARKRLGIKPDSFVIGYLGRLAFEKDLVTLYRAFMRFKKSKKDVKLLMIGDGKEEIIKIFKDKKDIIRLKGVSDAENYYAAMDCHVLTSLTETTSLVTLEAMASGLPVIATEVGLIKEYIKDNKNGLLIQKKNSFKLSLQLEKLYTDKSFRQQLGKAARKTVIDEFSWKKTVKGLLDALEEI